MLILSPSGSQVFSWGQNRYGQLGLGVNEQSISTPQIIQSLLGIPFAQISAGGAHSFTLTLSGAVFGWGRNKFGQLGLNDSNGERGYWMLIHLKPPHPPPTPTMLYNQVNVCMSWAGNIWWICIYYVVIFKTQILNHFVREFICRTFFSVYFFELFTVNIHSHQS